MSDTKPPTPPASAGAAAASKTPTQFGQYVVQRELGRGGMGVVYLASDLRLERSVALKVLADQVADEPERLARLSREAKSLATLNHPNVASIYGIEEQPQPAGHSRSILVLEYVPGPTLSERLRAGPLPMDEALRIMAQVAGGLEAAHERGLIHRDLKPDNIKVTPEGQAKVLDFGLAKAESPIAARPPGTVGVTIAPGSALSVHTRVGVVMGTPGYMSPEQCRGKTLDKRTDIWSFGCVLFECLTGKQVFTGETLSDAIAAVLEREADFDALPARTPPRVVELLHKCLEKDTTRRLRDIGDARIELEMALAKREYTPSGAMAAVRASTRGRGAGGRRWPVGLILAGCTGFLAGTLAGALGGRATGLGSSSVARPLRVSVLLDSPPIAVPTVAIAPGGALVLYPATVDREGRRDTALAWKRLDTGATGTVKDLWGVQSVAIAPDGSSAAVTSGGGDSVQLVRVMLKDGVPSGAPVPVLRDAPRYSQIAWQNAGSLLVLSPAEGTLGRVRLAGGELEPVWRLERQGGVRLGPFEAVPGDQWAIVTRMETRGAELRTELLRVSLTAGTAETLVDGASHPRYMEPGLLLYGQGTDVVARPFNPSAGAFTGEPVSLGVGALSGRSAYSVSREGTLALPPASLGDFSRTLLIVDTAGKSRRLYDKPVLAGNIVAPSPSGDRVALAMYEADPYQPTALRVLDVRRGTLTSVPGGAAAILGVAWSPDGERLIWSRGELGKGSVVYSGQADGGGTARELVKSDDRLLPVLCTPDGASVIVTTQDKDRVAKAPQYLDIKTGALSPLGSASAAAREFAVSPDGALIAYNAPAAGERARVELFVERFDVSAAADQDRPRVQVSVDGVTGPARFGADGRSVVFVTGGKRIVEATIALEPKLNVGADLKALGELDASADSSGWTTRTGNQAIGGWSPQGLVIAATPRGDGRRELATIVTGVPALVKHEDPK